MDGTIRKIDCNYSITNQLLSDESWKQLLLWEVDEQDKQEATASLAAAKETSMDAAGASILSESGDVLTLKKERH